MVDRADLGASQLRLKGDIERTASAEVLGGFPPCGSNVAELAFVAVQSIIVRMRMNNYTAPPLQPSGTVYGAWAITFAPILDHWPAAGSADWGELIRSSFECNWA